MDYRRVEPLEGESTDGQRHEIRRLLLLSGWAGYHDMNKSVIAMCEVLDDKWAVADSYKIFTKQEAFDLIHALRKNMQKTACHIIRSKKEKK